MANDDAEAADRTFFGQAIQALDDLALGQSGGRGNGLVGFGPHQLCLSLLQFTTLPSIFDGNSQLIGHGLQR